MAAESQECPQHYTAWSKTAVTMENGWFLAVSVSRYARLQQLRHHTAGPSIILRKQRLSKRIWHLLVKTSAELCMQVGHIRVEQGKRTASMLDSSHRAGATPAGWIEPARLSTDIAPTR
eukprot:6195464-Pleurochrysis_carterae.AAC.2